MTGITDRLAKVRARIAAAAAGCGRNPDDITLLAVSKTKPVAAIAEAWRAAQTAYGENYLQDALDKMSQLHDLEIEWHFIGRIQSNKTRPIAEHFDWVHSLSDARHAQRLSAQRPPERGQLNVCLQLNLSGQTSKAGTSEDLLPNLANLVATLPGLRLRGLMTMPDPTKPVARQRADYRRLAELARQLRAAGLHLDTLSMGMSADLEAAIEDGSTLVRVGTDIFGPRK